MSKTLLPITFEEMPGWHAANHQLSLEAFQRSAQEILSTATGFRRKAAFGGEATDWRAACEASLAATDATTFFEKFFCPLRVVDGERPEGLFTGYYEPLVNGSLHPNDDYPVPVYAKPADLVAFTPDEVEQTGLSYGRRVNGVAHPYDTREDVENGSLAGKADVICWLSDWVDAFFMHVQGQGRVKLKEGHFLRLSYAGKAGHAYTGIGHVLVERGLIPKEKMSMQTLRAWMQENPSQARALMWQNKSYIFFQATNVENAGLGGIGAAKVNLTPGHSLAVDRSHWMFGTPLWIDTHLPPEASSTKAPVRRLMIAQDTGSAIKGLIRGDFFWGWGEEAINIAGHMKSAGQMVALLPRAVARQFGFIA